MERSHRRRPTRKSSWTVHRGTSVARPLTPFVRDLDRASSGHASLPDIHDGAFVTS